MSNLRFVYFSEFNHRIYQTPLTIDNVVKRLKDDFAVRQKELRFLSNENSLRKSQHMKLMLPLMTFNILSLFYKKVREHKWSSDDFHVFIITNDILNYFNNFCNFHEFVVIDRSEKASLNLNVDSLNPRLNWIVVKFPENHLELWKTKLNDMLKHIVIPDELKPFYGENACVN